MNSTILTPLESNKNDLDKSKSTVKLLVFPIGKLTVALPVARVKKVIKYTQIYGSGLNHVNLTHMDKKEVTVVDLHQKLFKISHDELTEDGGYFVITKPKQTQEITSNSTEEAIAIRVIEAPILIDVALSNIRTLPNNYRYADTLEIASHVAVIPQENQTNVTVFILDLEHLI